jgi:hypothetical protein
MKRPTPLEIFNEHVERAGFEKCCNEGHAFASGPLGALIHLRIDVKRKGVTVHCFGRDVSTQNVHEQLVKALELRSSIIKTLQFYEYKVAGQPPGVSA